MADVRFDGKVAVVTGAGGGLGRTYAILLGSRGAKVVVNDLGGKMDGTGKGSEMADAVIKEIKAAGGDAVANYDSVSTAEGGAGIIKTAVEKFGTIDILINNAGILRDKSLLKMEENDWDLVVAVHLKGAYNTTKAAFPIMKEKGFGRIVNTTSAAGLYGNFGQTNYAAAKMGLVGFMNALKQEGQKYNVLVNTIAPIAGSRLTATVMPPEMLEVLKPEFVAPLTCFLCSAENTFTGGIFCAGGGYMARTAMQENPGAYFDIKKGISLEDVRAKFADISTMREPQEFGSVGEESARVFKNLSV